MISEKNIRNVFIYSLPKIFKYGLYFFALPVLTRHLTPEDFGVVALAFAFPTIAVEIVSAGMSSSVARYYFEYRKDQKKLNALFFSSQVYLFIMFAVSAAFVFYAREHISKLVTGKTDYGMAVFIAYLAMYLDQINSFFFIIYQNMEKATVHSTFTILQAITGISVSLLLVLYWKMSYMGMLYGSFAAALVVCLGLFMHFNRNISIDFSRKMLYENLKYGIQVIPNALTGFINKFFDKYMLNEMISMAATGIYNIGQTLSNTLFFVMGNVWMSFQPIYYREVFDNGAGASEKVGRLFTVFAYITLFPIIIMILFAQEILYLMAPPSYYEAAGILVVLAAGIATQTFGMYVGVQYAYSKRPFWIFPVSVAGTIINVALNSYLIPIYGLMGAGFATIFSTSAVNMLLAYIGQKLYRIEYEWHTLGPIFLTIIVAMLVSLYFMSGAVSMMVVYPVKLIFLATFLYMGIRTGIISRKSLEKVRSSLFRSKKTSEV